MQSQSVAVDRITEAATEILKGLDLADMERAYRRIAYQEEWPYVDSDSRETRALDAFIGLDISDVGSRTPYPHAPSEILRFKIDILLECKQSELPYLFFMRAAHPGDVPRFCGLPHEWISARVGDTDIGFSVRIYDVIVARDLPLAEATSNCYLNDQSASTRGQDAGAFWRGRFQWPCFAAVQGGALPPWFDSAHQARPHPTIRLALPVAVINATHDWRNRRNRRCTNREDSVGEACSC